MTERVAIVGAGMAGLCTALALARRDRPIVIIERDPPPPGDAEAAFDHWARRGATQLRHSHAFLARLRGLIASEHPALLAALREAGARELRFADGLPPAIADGYLPIPQDEALAIIVSRRTTLETVIRRHVEALPDVTIRSNTFVRGLITARDSAGRPVVGGLRLEGGEEIAADLTIDAGGRGSAVIDWLAEAGLEPPEEREDCAILYYTRFYRRRPGVDEPPRSRFPTTGDLGYLKFGVFPADNDTFSITLAAPEIEQALRTAVMAPPMFDAICARLPGVAPWTDPASAAPESRVHAMGALESRWREMAPCGQALALGLFSVGDSLVRTNPLFGRGCSFAAVEAHILRDVLDRTADPHQRARDYSAAVRRELRPFYDDMVRLDRSAARRARNGLDPDHRPSWRSRLMTRFAEDGVAIALRQDVALLRSAMRAFHMLDPPRAWLGRPAALAKIFAALARGRRANAHLYAEKAGPGRREMFAALNLPAEADLARLRAA